MSATTTPVLTAARVRETLCACLFKDDEIDGDTPPPGAVLVDGIMSRYALHPGRVSERRADIAEMLTELPATFREGWSFLMAWQDRHGNHWGEHPDMEALFVLGMAAGAATSVLPRERWGCLPRGMPYYIVPGAGGAT